MAEIVCRICLGNPKTYLKRMWTLQDRQGEHTYASMFTEVSCFPVFEYEPQTICEGCRLQLIDSFWFKMKCQSSQQIIMSYVEVKDEITEDIKVEPLTIETGQPLDAQVRDVDVQKVVKPLSKPVEFTEISEKVETTDEAMEEALNGGSSNQSFADDGEDLLVEMGQKEEPTKKFRCSSCGYAVNSVLFLEQHLKKIHAAPKESCPYCSVLNYPDLQQHHLETCPKNPTLEVEAQQNNWLTCPYCAIKTKWFKSIGTLAIHCYAKHKKKRSLAACRLCNNSYFLELLPKHERECKNYPVECPHCQGSIPFNRQDYHLKVCSQNPANREEALLKNYVMCEVCGTTSKWYKNTKKLLAHKIADHGHDRSASCQYCERAFYPEHLKKHERACGKNPSKFICDLCNRGYAKKAAIENHMKNDHLKLAANNIHQKSTTLTHRGLKTLTHRALKPYDCPVSGDQSKHEAACDQATS